MLQNAAVKYLSQYSKGAISLIVFDTTEALELRMAEVMIKLRLDLDVVEGCRRNMPLKYRNWSHTTFISEKIGM